MVDFKSSLVDLLLRIYKNERPYMMAEGDLYQDAKIRFIESEDSSQMSTSQKQLLHYIAIFNQHSVLIVDLSKRIQEFSRHRPAFDISCLKDDDNI